jgi:hypothetical protein
MDRELRAEFSRWASVEQEAFNDEYGDRFPTCHPDVTARRLPQRFRPLFSDLEPEIIGRGNYLTEGLWFYPDNGEVLKLSYR